MSKGTSIFFSSQDTVSMFVGYMSSKYSLTWPMFMLTRLKTIRVIEKALYCMHTESRGQQWQRKRSRKWPKDWVKQLVPVIPGPWNWNKRICLRSKVEKRKRGIIQGQRAHSDEHMKNVDPSISFSHDFGLQEAFLHVYTSHRTLGRKYIPKIKSHLSPSLNRLYITSFMRKAFSLCS